MPYDQLIAIIGIIVWLAVSYHLWVEMLDKEVNFGAILGSLLLGILFGVALIVVVWLLGGLIGIALGIVKL